MTNADGGLVTVGTAGEGLFVVGYLAGSTETLKICAAEGDTVMSAGHLSAVGLLFEIGTGALVFNHTDADYKFGTPIYGAGAVDVLAGVSTLSTSYYTGDTMATGGSLLLSGSLRGDSYVSGSGILGGTGVARNIYVHSGGILAPGASIGTLSAEGVVDLETGYSFEVEINDAGNSDMLVATGDVTIAAGASLVIQPESLGEDCSTNDWVMTYQLIAPNSVTGVFNAVTESFAFMDVLTIYERKAVFLA